ncbi:tRNA (adenosine(37)-N6)-dimethylallyltransferase MiaA [Aquimarina agarivorans]|uniref:tRNA (adenosine(37)-N6)-dimethylallyltransferase MiaA n=1 Tax=Aquimarina agarivorans TaxID=980584 RepID=UPI000248EAF6|nr:tRNA (adenosine(37)-N6)-dimethylallyltransferase MiaA [Aquimarina agarivorans]
MDNTNKTLIVVVGPTAIGKTALGIKLAQHFNTEIISADSRQFFKEMCIGTAVPDPDELAAAKHHFIQHISIEQKYSVGDFEKEALKKLDELFKTEDTAIMVGGSGLYVDAVCYGLDKFPEVDSETKKFVAQLYQEKGLEAVAEILKEKDPEHYNIIELQNPHRVLRAVEVCLASGKPYSSFLKDGKVTRPFNIIKIGLKADRKIIYNRINQRVDIMIKNGLLDEAKNLIPYKHLNALNTVGYKELFQYFEGSIDLDTAIAEIKKNTRRFAKRQLTWYRKDDAIHWFDYTTTIEKIVAQIESLNFHK